MVKRSSRAGWRGLAACAALATGLACGADDTAPPAEPPVAGSETAAAPEIDPAGVASAAATEPVTAVAAGGGRSYATFAHVCAVVSGEVQCFGAGGRGHFLSPFPASRSITRIMPSCAVLATSRPPRS